MMASYIEMDGIANADRLRKEHAGEVYLQVPQSVLCDHGVKSHHQGMNNKLLFPDKK